MRGTVGGATHHTLASKCGVRSQPTTFSSVKPPRKSARPRATAATGQRRSRTAAAAVAPARAAPAGRAPGV